MKILVCGPGTLEVIEPDLANRLGTRGYPFPLVTQLVCLYREMGHQVTFVSSSKDAIELIEARSGDIEIVLIPSRSSARHRAWDAFRVERSLIESAIKLAEPDVVHAHWTYEFAMPALKSGYPTLVTVHDWAPAIARRLQHPYWLVRLAMQVHVLRRAKHLSAPSEYIRTKIRRWYRKDCEVIHNAIEQGTSASSPKIEMSFRVGMLNNSFDRLKNVRTALRAWPLVRPSRKATLVLAGPDFDDDGPCHRWAKANGLDHDVEFAGPIPASDVQPWLSALDVFCHTSLEESFGMVALEAMAAGLPVIYGKRSGALHEVVGPAGVPVDDMTSPRELAHVLQQVMEETDELRSSRAVAARAQASKFNLDRTAKAYLALLSRIAGLRGAAWSDRS